MAEERDHPALPNASRATSDALRCPAVSGARTLSVGSVTALDPALYVPQELRQQPRRDGYEVDDAINIIEEGEQVSAEDFGLSSTEISMNAPITIAVGMELSAIQHIDAFLAARPTTEHAPAGGISPRANQPHQPNHLRQRAERTPITDAKAVAQEDVSPEEQTNSHEGLMTQGQPPFEPIASSPCTSAPGLTTPTAVPYPTRRDDKVLQLESHPLVDSVASDGRHVVCKCGKNVRLNPPWYIAKYEQHIVSRNCTFLRKKKTKRDQEAQEKVATRRRNDACVTAGDEVGEVSAHGDHQPLPSRETPPTDELRGEMASDDVRMDAVDSASGPVNAPDDRYGLRTASDLLRYFTGLMACAAKASEDSSFDGRGNERSVESLRVLSVHPHFNRITPDGKFLECKCSDLIILSIPWGLREFHAHVDAKSKPQVAPRRKSPSSSSVKKPRLGDGAFHRVEQRLIVRETRWKAVSKSTELPCPGLRGERISAYISSTAKITGGSRTRRRIAEELFPEHFVSVDSNKKAHPRLSADEKVMLRDAVESEALWFIDHDANAVRSLDCRGSITVSKDEDSCSSCAELRSNASLRISVTVAMGHKRIPDDATTPLDSQGPYSAPKASTAAFALLEQEFDTTEEFARLLRDLFRADVEESSVKNMWFDMAELGINGSFGANPTFLGLLEAMMALKEKERRGVGLQNMTYSEHLDAFMKSLSDISPQACDFFQQHLGGRKQKYILLMKKRKLDGKDTESHDHDITNTTASEHLEPGSAPDVPAPAASGDNYGHLSFDLASNTMHNLPDMHDVDLASFHPEPQGSIPLPSGTDASTQNDETDAFLTDENMEITDADADDDSAHNAPTAVAPTASTTSALGYIPCRGLRDPKVQAYVVNAVKIIGGSRPKYVIAKELFPEAFDGSRKIKITEKLTEHERRIVSDAIFSECLWRVDRVSNCVRSLRCFRRVDRKRTNGVCRACLDLKSIANFRSVLCRAKVPKKVENLKFVPSVYTESDPFMRKLSKNASLRALYQTVKRVAPDDKKKVTLWLRLAKMGLFGHFRSHVAFEGLIASMVEIKDRERCGVGKQNMLYAKSLDDFMAELATISMDAFELFSHHFCGRTMRSQKVKKRKALTQLYDSAIQQAMVANSLAMASASLTPAMAPEVAVSEMTTPTPTPTTMAVAASVPTTTATTSVGDAHAMMISEDLLGAARPITTAEMEESQRFMDRMLDEVQLSVATEDHEQDEHLDPQTYLDENGVLTTVL